MLDRSIDSSSITYISHNVMCKTLNKQTETKHSQEVQLFTSISSKRKWRDPIKWHTEMVLSN